MDIKPDWIIDISIDYHPSKEIYILFMATTPYDIKYIIHEIISPYGERMGLEWMQKVIIDTIKKYNLRINRICIDPLSKGFGEGITVYDKLSDYLASFGYPLEVANKNKDDGIIMLNDLLNNKGGTPRLYFYTDALPKSMRQIKGWRFEYNDKREAKAAKVDDDAPECLYRLALLDTKYTEPYEDEETPYVPNNSNRNSVTGY